MAHPVPIQFHAIDADALPNVTGRIVVLVDGAPGGVARRLDRLMRGALTRAVASEGFAALKPGDAMDIAFPAGLAAETVQLVRLPRKTDVLTARKAGGAIGKSLSPLATLVLGEHPRAADIAFGLAMRAYDFSPHKTGDIGGGAMFVVVDVVFAKDE